MNGGRRRFQPPAGEESPAARPLRRSRLSRSFRQSQVDPARSPGEPGPAQTYKRNQTAPLEVPESTGNQKEPEFKTPTRISRSKTAPVPSAESPHNDSDFQQDIIWDATSPSPHKPGKRGKKAAAGAVTISEIVRRIAPKHGRPQVTEPTLQSAIPCTPDVQGPKPKKKSPRTNGVEDLLRLARQFDLNMFHQDEEEEDEDESSRQDESCFPGNLQPATNMAAGSEPQPPPDRLLVDDLDFLFDGPTQRLSGDLSQAPSQTRSASASVEVNRKPSVSGSGSATGKNKQDSVPIEFEDDWDNDDLLNDSLVLEMTQNPLSFMVPELCSTQKPAGSARAPERAAPGQSSLGRVTPRLVSLDKSSAGRVGPPAGSRVEKENLRPAAAFKPNRTFGSPRKSIEANTSSAQQVGSGSKNQNRFRSLSGPQLTGPTSSFKQEPQRTQNNLRTPAGTAETLGSNQVDFLDDDLDSLFSSEPVWDDPADDDLLCEMCDDLENQILIQVQLKTEPSTRQAPVPALQPTHRTWENRDRLDTAGRAVGSSLAAGVKQPIRFSQPKPAADTAFRSVQSEPPGAGPPPNTQHYTFKKPSNLVSIATVKGKCSAAEIEMKKQQALERRRQRLQAVGNRPGNS
ncbi:PREDICTED: LOW QUALITY PROTEIN: ewing's tumor-associated antigen 1 homolog [Cyprinodon variegatus]|uniref:LOW QUALITY PROTEIN: ewing's tumor-associated antigen 1 homolog n=1 Tax=Cyprinodon variegatus TaxID=28743 RepID=UPI0007426E65|nr:PREDICTED: LOW QUALITY PROTEIN: ewing's tumor-associated antigen 1 homolog [Cyprinodon variegatus]